MLADVTRKEWQWWSSIADVAILLSITSNVCSMECRDISTSSRTVTMMIDFMLDVLDDDDALFEFVILTLASSFSRASSEWFGFPSRLTRAVLLAGALSLAWRYINGCWWRLSSAWAAVVGSSAAIVPITATARYLLDESFITALSACWCWLLSPHVSSVLTHMTWHVELVSEGEEGRSKEIGRERGGRKPARSDPRSGSVSLWLLWIEW